MQNKRRNENRLNSKLHFLAALVKNANFFIRHHHHHITKQHMTPFAPSTTSIETLFLASLQNPFGEGHPENPTIQSIP